MCVIHKKKKEGVFYFQQLTENIAYLKINFNCMYVSILQYSRWLLLDINKLICHSVFISDMAPNKQ